MIHFNAIYYLQEDSARAVGFEAHLRPDTGMFEWLQVTFYDENASKCIVENMTFERTMNPYEAIERVRTKLLKTAFMQSNTDFVMLTAWFDTEISKALKPAKYTV
jgi:hypothetical protein